MKNRGIILSVIFAATTLAGVASTAIMMKKYKVKHRAKRKEQMKYDREYAKQYYASFERGVYIFSNVNDMNRARLSKKFNVLSYYELQDEAYLVVLMDGNEDDIENYGGRIVDEEEFEEFLEKTSVETMYFAFDDVDNFKGFQKALVNILPNTMKFPIIQYKGFVYVDLGKIDESLHNNVSCVAGEFLGMSITDMYIANRLEFLFAIADE